jgi:hypothetical protein
VETDQGESRRAAAQRLLMAADTAVVQDAAILLVADRSAQSMAVLCEALATHEARGDWEAQETILGVLSPAWKSGEVDVPSLLRDVQRIDNEQARTGSMIAVDWLQIGA